VRALPGLAANKVRRRRRRIARTLKTSCRKRRCAPSAPSVNSAAAAPAPGCCEQYATPSSSKRGQALNTASYAGLSANDSKYGLHAAVVGSDIGRSRRVASNLRAGRLVINGMTDDPQAPWGGFKYSGVGREYGQYGIEAFLETRAVLEA
jgi:Aldehyde dehydrogenase family